MYTRLNWRNIMSRPNNRMIATGLACAIALGNISPGIAAPAMSSTTTLKTVQPSDVVNIRWRGRRGAWAAAGVGFLAGALIGSAIARSRARSYYYYDGPVYYESPPVYVEPAPVYVSPRRVYAGPRVDPNGPIRRCWVRTDNDRPYGYWRPC